MLGWKQFPETNTLAYWAQSQVTKKCSVVNKAPRVLITTHHFLHSLQLGPISLEHRFERIYLDTTWGLPAQEISWKLMYST
jgi:hypothetical protein